MDECELKNNYTRSIYTQFIKNLSLDTLDSKVRRFINELDTDDINSVSQKIIKPKKLLEIIQNTTISSSLKNRKFLATEIYIKTIVFLLKTGRFWGFLGGPPGWAWKMWQFHTFATHTSPSFFNATKNYTPYTPEASPSVGKHCFF